MWRSRRGEETALMDADWYVDPLGRFDGRFFDGEHWTERVSDDGAPAIDLDFLTLGTTTNGASGAEAEAAPESELAGGASGDDLSSSEPAVVRVDVGRHLKASIIQESPARTVAVLDESVVKLAVPASLASANESRSRRAPIVWGLLGLIAALVVAGLVLLGRDDSRSLGAAAEPVELDSEQEARVEDLEEGGMVDDIETEAIEELAVDAPTGAVAPGSSFEPAEAIQVGGLRILNGQSVLDELEAWHVGFAAQRGVELEPSASCWFGQLGGAAVQVAHCGPDGGAADSEYLFDSVPLLFEDAPRGGQVAQPVVDAATTDTVLANALTLVGRDGDLPPLSLEGATRGDRGAGSDESGE